MSWSGLIWFGGNILHHSFHAQLVLRNRLEMMDSLCQRIGGIGCLLCVERSESQDYLFLECAFGFRV